MKKLKELISMLAGLGLILLLVFFAYIGAKSFFKAAWVGNSYHSYERTLSGGKEYLFFLPDNEVILLKGIPSEDAYIGYLYFFQATQGTHYFGNIWNISESPNPFGIRIFEKDEVPWITNLSLLDKWLKNASDPEGPEVGSRFRGITIFKDESIEILDMSYSRIDFPEDEIMELRKNFERR